MKTETDEWTKALDRMNRRSEAKMRKEVMPATKDECLKAIEAETAKCYFHSHGWNPPYRCRLVAHAKKQGWL